MEGKSIFEHVDLLTLFEDVESYLVNVEYQLDFLKDSNGEYDPFAKGNSISELYNLLSIRDYLVKILSTIDLIFENVESREKYQNQE